MLTWPTKPFTKLPLGGVGSTGTWGRLVCVCAVAVCVQRVHCAGCVRLGVHVCVCVGGPVTVCLCVRVYACMGCVENEVGGLVCF